MAARTPGDELAIVKRKLAAQQHLLEKLRAIRAMHMVSYTGAAPVEKVAVEFYYAIGDILEGQQPKELNLKVINKEEFLKEMQDGP